MGLIGARKRKRVWTIRVEWARLRGEGATLFHRPPRPARREVGHSDDSRGQDAGVFPVEMYYILQYSTVLPSCTGMGLWVGFLEAPTLGRP